MSCPRHQLHHLCNPLCGQPRKCNCYQDMKTVDPECAFHRRLESVRKDAAELRKLNQK